MKARLNFERVEQLIRDGYITRKKHPQADLWIYNYTAKTQYQRLWTSETVQCRGLILDADHNVVARGFKKFFNLGETDNTTLENLPQQPFEVTAKLDGSLGILYRVNGSFAVATRGSFDGAQARWATRFLNEHYDLSALPPYLTLLFEIIYPDNRVVVDYGEKRDLVLIGVIDHVTDFDLGYRAVQVAAKRFGFNAVDTLKIDSLQDLIELKQRSVGVEGWVIKFQNGGFRIKIKTDEYTQLHRLVFGLTVNRVRDAILEDWESFTEQLPEEFRVEVEDIARKIWQRVISEQYRYYVMFQNIPEHVKTNKKLFALYVKREYPQDHACLFSIYNGHTFQRHILRSLDVSDITRNV